MASSKRRRKRAAQDRKQRLGLGPSASGPAPLRHRDGDRRLRSAMSHYRQILARKEALREWTIDSGEPLDLPPE